MWSVQPIDWLAVDSEIVEELNLKDSTSLRVRDEAAIGLAFATIKMRAECPSDVAEYGLAALKRTGVLIEGSTLTDDLKSEWKVAEGKMASKLKSCQI